MALTSPVKEHPYSHLIDTLKDGRIKFFNPQKLNDPRYDKLPLSIRVLLEAAVRNCDGFYTKKEDVQNLLDWQQQQNKAEVPFSPARILLQDFTGIPAMVDLAAMRDAVAKHGVDPSLVNPKCPTDLIVDHSLQIDYSKCAIQNAPNPGGGGDGPNQSQGPSRSAPSRPPSRGGSQCGGQRGSCSKAACSDPPASPGRPPTSVQQIENTPLLCPFHLKPVSETETALKNQEMELIRNKERLQFFKWCSKAFMNVNVVPPDVGTVHQVNMEYLSRVVQGYVQGSSAESFCKGTRTSWWNGHHAAEFLPGRTLTRLELSGKESSPSPARDPESEVAAHCQDQSRKKSFSPPQCSTLTWTRSFQHGGGF
ncbi:iron-responsive element-binding protein 2 [Lates japonicus]|uniref:Iron-responsive element-binding protein 2 n=1 Tax=Lates japonicus TaxID=270547 RepID=A0AAD3QUW4_LATJO|nr:iron-responsive element-binding protein 2 [Lates japonicus]